MTSDSNPPPSGGLRTKILVVDDTEATRYAVARTLIAQGYEIIEAGDGAEALRQVLLHNPSLVTLDIHLPDILGFEVCRRIKNNPETAHIPVLQVSASYVTSKDRIHGLEGGADSYLTHPFEPPVLVATVKALLRASELTKRLKESELRLSEALRAAEIASTEKTKFLSHMSHEIRTPLGVIQGFADLALEEEMSSSKRGEFLHTIKRNAENLTRLIGDILDLNKIEAGKVEIESVATSLRPLIEEVLSGFEPQAAKKNTILMYSFDPDVPQQILIDAGRVRQILVNLIGNSIKFTSGGEVAIRVQLDRGSLCIRVEDSGIGVTEEQAARLFEDFTQAASSTSREYGGTGLGLSLSRKLAHAMQGELRLLEYGNGRGCVFALKLPLKSVDPSDPSATLGMGEARLDGLRILLVEDTIDNTELFTHYLSRAGAVVVPATNGHEALEWVEKENFDVILMDIQMPGMDGYAATRELKARGVSTPVVALSANALKDDRASALSLGFADYLTKPVNLRILAQRLLEVIEDKKSFR